MKIGVVGLGFMGATHLEAYAKIPEAEIVAVASSDEKKLSGDLSSAAGNLGTGGQTVDFSSVAKYRTADELLADANVEAVDLCTPTDLHASQSIAALEAGKHVLVEKPMGRSEAECLAMIGAAEQADRVLMVAQVLRFFPDWTAMRDLVRSGQLGQVRHAIFHRRCAAPEWSKWMKDRSRSGGGVFDLLIHDFDFCQQLFGTPAAVTAHGYEDLEAGIDSVDALLDYPDGPIVNVIGGWRHPKAYPFSMEFTIVCEKGTLDYHSGLRGLTLYNAAGDEVEAPKPESDGFVGELQAFIAACNAGSAPAECRPQDSAESVRMTLAMRDSRDQGGKRIEL